MLRTVIALSMTLALYLPLSAGEMDNDVASKKSPVPAVAKQDALATNIASSEMDSESPTQSWRRYGWGGWGRGWGWGGGWRGGWGWGGGFYQPWGVVSFGYRPWGGYYVGGCW